MLERHRIWVTASSDAPSRLDLFAGASRLRRHSPVSASIHASSPTIVDRLAAVASALEIRRLTSRVPGRAQPEEIVERELRVRMAELGAHPCPSSVPDGPPLRAGPLQHPRSSPRTPRGGDAMPDSQDARRSRRVV